MIHQKFFNYQFPKNQEGNNFFTNHTNQEAFDFSNMNDFEQNIFLYGQKKSGKTHLMNIWKERNNAIIFKNNFSSLLQSKSNIAIDDVLVSISEEKLFHLINH